MKSRIPTCLLAAIALLGLGCDQSFNPKEDFQEQYVLQCFVEVSGWGGYPEVVTAVLAKTYDVAGVDPAANTVDPAIAGAELKLTVNQKSFYLLGTQRTNPDTSRYKGAQWIYSSTVPYIMPNAAITLTAKLPNGRTLSARTAVPSGRDFQSNYDFSAGLTSPFNLEPGKPNWALTWDENNDVEAHLFVPRLTLTYTKLVGTNEMTYTVIVPSRFVATPGGVVPIYPSASTQMQCAYEFAALDSTMAQLSAGEPDKKAIGVHGVRLEVIEYDGPLSKYVSSINGSLDQYSIRTDESVYSNVSGGIGIVGAYIIHWKEFTFDERYVNRFGYRFR